MKPGPEETLSFNVSWSEAHGHLVVCATDPRTDSVRFAWGLDTATALRLAHALLGVVAALEGRRSPGLDA